MKTADSDVNVAPFRGAGSQSEDVFGKIKRENEPSVKDLLAWNEPENLPRPPRAANKNPDWVSEAHDAFKSYMQASLVNPRPLSSFQPKPIESEEERPPKSLSPKTGKLQNSGKPGKTTLKGRTGELSSSPKANKKANLGENNSKTPKAENFEKKASQRQAERLKKLNQTTRWLPNSAFKTYFGKPIFANYGMGNVNPTYGGLMYGDYMKTHNIAPHEGANNPQTQQVYEIAETKALQKTAKPQIVPRKCRDEDRLPPEEVEKLKQRSLILAKNKSKVSKEIIKPNLLEEKLFKSEHNTPRESDDEQVPLKSKPSQVTGKKVTNNGNSEPGAKNKPEPKKDIKAQDLDQNDATAGKSAKDQKDAPDQRDPNQRERNSRVSLPKSANNRNLNDEEKQITDKNDVEGQFEERLEERYEDKSQDASVQAEDCLECNRQNFGKLIRTSYQDMTGKVTVDKNNQIVEPYKYCVRCRDSLYNEDVLKPPYSLGEIPPQELNPKNYKTLPPQWTQRIPAAGKLSYRSPSAYNVIFGENQPLGGSE